MYTLPFEAGKTVIELGGGTNPMFRPNVDVRSGAKVDYVADFDGGKLPVLDGSFDNVYCAYALEHISWRSVDSFLKETFRILRPGGTSVFVTANLLEQSKRIVEESAEGLDSKYVCMLFGDQDYPENTHRSGFTPHSLSVKLREVGYSDVVILPHPVANTDMIVEARKQERTEKIHPELWTPEERKRAYDRRYFDGARGNVGGYSKEGYWDYPVHWTTFQRILGYNPSSVLELGAARGYVLKRLEDEGVRVNGLEVSRHCYLTRATNKVLEWDITQTPWPIRDKEFDLCFSIATLEHIPEDKIPIIAKEMERVTKRGLHGIDFGHKDDGFDKTHCTLRSAKWWKERLPEGQIVVDKEELESGPIPLPSEDGKIKLNVGSFTTMFHHGWMNLDSNDLGEFARRNGYKFLRCNLPIEIPYKEGTVDLMSFCHFLEKSPYPQSEDFLRECYRVMKVGGVLRIAMLNVPNLLELYNRQDLIDFDEINEGCAAVSPEIAKLWELLFRGHQSMYDFPTISGMLKKVGFSEVGFATFRETNYNPQILRETLDLHPSVSFYVEALK